jgi:hypothetical protein
LIKNIGKVYVFMAIVIQKRKEADVITDINYAFQLITRIDGRTRKKTSFF